ncbi:Nramp family divalent metal transporter [Lacrimispora defluvii]|uniref:Divalent metal cation transporter n=1 Tax=Lacrimispora defluvii TaxID=2719233 RepID=A0ABX1VUM8_9FIRM|nr:Nramp family divalent metal transporter [Lacrimispora defluvii]NNJ32051.1 divalent metal cation transporter [Lacrimispora defluvii]
MVDASVKKKNLWRNFLLFLVILGPGIVTGSVDNDVGGITTYSVAGAEYGYSLLWTLIPAFIVLFVTQEMNARMGIVTGKGLADLIRENMGVKVTFFIFIFLLGADILNTMTEFSGVAGSMQIFHVSKYISVPLAAVGVWVMVVKGTYRIAERIFLLFSLCLLVYIVAALMGRPDWNEIGRSLVKPDVETNFAYISTVIGIIGTTIAPWMQFYMQSAVIEKKLQIKDLKFSKLDVFIGCICTVVVAFFIIIACASTLHVSGTHINDASDAAAALQPLAGVLAAQVFAFGLFVASIFACVILPVATAFYVCEAFGFEAGIDKKWNEAPQFYWLYTAILVISAGIILIPNVPLIQISLWSQRINGILLPVVLICMIIIVNKKDVMGDYVNKPISNIISWLTIILLLGLSATLVISLFG